MREFNNGDFVYLITDDEQLKRMIVSIEYPISGSTLYKLVCGTMYSTHFAQEMSHSKDLNMIMGTDNIEQD